MSEKNLNVCLYTPTADGGHALYAQELLTAIAEVGTRRGVAPELVTSENLAPSHRTNAYPIHPILPRLAPRGSYPSVFAWAASRISYYSRRERVFLDWVSRREDIDLIHFQEYTPWLAPKHWLRLRRIGYRLVFTVHNVFLHYYRNFLYKVIRDTCLRRAWRECDALLVHSEGLKDALADFLGPGHPPISVTPHGIWNGRHEEAPVAVEPGEGLDRILFFGVLRPNKGLHVLLQAMDRLPGCHLTAAGEPDDRAYHGKVCELARRLPADRVQLIDRYVDESEVPDLFRQCRLVILPYTFFASQSGVLHMALAHGRPVVASDLGAMGECVRRWGIGRVVPPCDERALASAITEALRPDHYRKAVEAISRVRDDLTWTRTAEATIDVYRAVVA